MACKDPDLDPAAILSQLLSREPDAVGHFLTGLIAALAQEGVSQETIRRAMTTALLSFLSNELASENPEASQRALAILKDAVAQFTADTPASH